MATRRQVHGHWVEVKRIVGGQVKQTTCCCRLPGFMAGACSEAAGNKTKCRCDCHRGKAGPTPESPDA